MLGKSGFCGSVHMIHASDDWDRSRDLQPVHVQVVLLRSLEMQQDETRHIFSGKCRLIKRLLGSVPFKFGSSIASMHSISCLRSTFLHTIPIHKTTVTLLFFVCVCGSGTASGNLKRQLEYIIIY